MTRPSFLRLNPVQKIRRFGPGFGLGGNSAYALRATNNEMLVAGLAFTSTDRIAGRSTSGAGAGEELVCTGAGRALLDDASAADQLVTLGVIAAVAAEFKRGEMYNFDTPTTVTIANPDEWTTIASGWTEGETDGVTFQNASELLIVTAGTYIVQWALSLNTAAAGVEIEAAVAVNGTVVDKTAAHLFFGTANDTGSLSGQGWLTLAEDDVLTMAVLNETSGTNVVMEHGSLLIERRP